ncbi:MAG: hypothetical protein AB7K04_17875 [Pseudorhodoplanes sp.]
MTDIPFAVLAAPERFPRAEQRRAAFRRFIVEAGNPVSLVDQVVALNLAHEHARVELRRLLHRQEIVRGSVVHQRWLAMIDGLRAARANIARLVEAEAAHIGGGLRATTQAQCDEAIAAQPTALELVP